MSMKQEPQLHDQDDEVYIRGENADILHRQDIVLAAQPGSLHLLHKALLILWKEIVRQIEPPPNQKVLDEIHVAAMEVVDNSIEHAYPVAGPQNLIRVEMTLRSDKIALTICDRGRPFDPVRLQGLCLPDPWSQSEQDRWGLGLALQALDYLCYARDQKGSNRWCLQKRLFPP